MKVIHIVFGVLAYLLVIQTAMRDTCAASLPEEQVEAILEILDKTSFDALGLDRGYGRLVLWERIDPIKIHVAVNNALMTDKEIPEWTRQAIVRMHQALGSNARISITGTEDTFGADILIVSTDQREFFSNDKFYQYMQENIGLPDRKIQLALEKIEEIHHGEETGWLWAKFDKNEADERTLGGFIGIIHPDKTIFKSVFPRLIATSLGYGNGSIIIPKMRIQNGKRMASVHVQFRSKTFHSSDHILLHFLYNSAVENGMRRDVAQRLLRKWLVSNYFKEYFLLNRASEGNK